MSMLPAGTPGTILTVLVPVPSQPGNCLLLPLIHCEAGLSSWVCVRSGGYSSSGACWIRKRLNIYLKEGVMGI